MLSGSYDLTGCTVAHLDFDLWLSSESGHDAAIYLVTYQGASYWYGAGGWSGDTPAGSTRRSTCRACPRSSGTIDLTGKSGVYVGFEFQSDAANTGEGAYVDQVSLTKDTLVGGPTITTISPSSAGAGVNAPVTITGSGFGASQGTGTVNFYYNGAKTIPAPVSSWSDTQIVCTVPTATVDGYPASAGTGPVTVTSGAGVTGPPYNGFTVTFGYGGSKWSSPGMTFQVNPNCADTASEAPLVAAGAALWNPPSNFLFTDGGATTATGYNYNGHNEIFWGTDLPAGVLAQARLLVQQRRGVRDRHRLQRLATPGATARRRGSTTSSRSPRTSSGTRSTCATSTAPATARRSCTVSPPPPARSTRSTPAIRPASSGSTGRGRP